MAAGLGLCEAELNSCSVADVLRGQHAAMGAVGGSAAGDGEPTAADVPATALARFLQVPAVHEHCCPSEMFFLPVY